VVTCRVMKQLRLYFKIIADNNCPIYQEGELLSLSEKALSCPENKATCLILVREMTTLLFKHLDADLEANDAEKKIYSCSGCTGLIKFHRISEDEAMQDGLISPEPPLDSEDEALLAGIRDFSLIQAIPESDLCKVVRCFRKERFPANTTFITKGQNCLYLYLILSGDIVVSDSTLVIASLGPGDICGEMSYLGGDVAGADVRTLTEAEVLSISGDAFSKLLDRIPELQLFMAKILVQRLTESNASHFEMFDACMSGWIREMPPAELFQIFHMNQKTGVLALDLPQGEAKVSFREGCVINAQYRDKINQAAIFAMLKEKDGRYAFTTGLSPDEMKAAEIGDFMMLLMEGIKRVDENEG
jgi:CRP/FNR family transcriptional regulator, cyclic AMP receptor protein